MGLLGLLCACSDWSLSTPAPPPDLNGFECVSGGADEAALLGVVFPECPEAPAVRPVAPAVLEWRLSQPGPGFCGPPALGRVADTDGDGEIGMADIPVLLVAEYSGVRGYRGDSGELVWQAERELGGSASYGGSLAVADLNGDRWPDVVEWISGVIAAYDGKTATVLWSSDQTRRSFLTQNFPVIADFDGDASPEIFVQGVSFSSEGTTNFVASAGVGEFYSVPISAVLSPGSPASLVAGDTAYRPNGNVRWIAPVPDGFDAVADLDGDGLPEIVVAYASAVSAVSAHGDVVWGPVSLTELFEPRAASPPAVGDVDGDGLPDIVVAGENRIDILDHDGNLVRHTTGGDESGAAGVVLADLNGDGAAEILRRGETSFTIFDGRTLARLVDEPVDSNETYVETPIVADIDNDGALEVAFGNCHIFGVEHPLEVWGGAEGGWGPGQSYWGQHALSGAETDALGAVPVRPVPAYLLANTFRAALTPNDAAGCLDAIPWLVRTCEDDCSLGLFTVAVSVANHGTKTLPAGVAISLLVDGVVLATDHTDEPVLPGDASAPAILSVHTA